LSVKESEQKETLNKLSKLSGAEFDREYMDHSEGAWERIQVNGEIAEKNCL
jgi:hypothetical protein